jgi:hypothetical protein
VPLPVKSLYQANAKLKAKTLVGVRCNTVVGGCSTC